MIWAIFRSRWWYFGKSAYGSLPARWDPLYRLASEKATVKTVGAWFLAVGDPSDLGLAGPLITRRPRINPGWKRPPAHAEFGTMRMVE